MKAYICAPYRADTDEGVLANVKRAVKYGEWIKENVLGTEPVVVHKEVLEKWGLSRSNTKGTEYDREITEFCMEKLGECAKLYVCGSSATAGMKAEIKRANSRGILVLAIPPNVMKKNNRI